MIVGILSSVKERRNRRAGSPSEIARTVQKFVAFKSKRISSGVSGCDDAELPIPVIGQIHEPYPRGHRPRLPCLLRADRGGAAMTSCIETDMARRERPALLDQANLNRVVDAYEATTRQAIEAARALAVPAVKPIVFRTGSLDLSGITRVLDAGPKIPRGEGKLRVRGFLYAFQQAAECSTDAASIKSAMRDAKAPTDGRDEGKLPAINADHEGRVLYVGRSWNIASRLRGHLRADCSRQTYALRLAAWARRLDLQVELFVWTFPGITDGTLQVVEDGLWDDLRPLFGRRGAK